MNTVDQTAAPDDALFAEETEVQAAISNAAFQGDDSDVDVDQQGEGEDTEIGMFIVYSHKCLKCTHLCADLEGKPGGRAYDSCHYSSGNTDCPAMSVQVCVGVPVSRIVSIILDSEATGDSERLTTTYARLAQKDPAIQAQLFEALREARESQ